MRINIKTTTDGFADWSLEVDVEQNTTVAELKEILSAPPYSLLVSTETRVLSKTSNGLHVALLDKDKARAKVTLLNVSPATKVLRFPEFFIWGSATSAYQIEGAVATDGRAPSIWDTFSEQPGKIANEDTGMVACEHYMRFREDVKLMKDLGLMAYRFSISWSRLLPTGRGVVNPMGVAFYSDLIDELLTNNIMPVVTLYHWDLPQCLEDEYGGWLGRMAVQDFAHYASVCFASFGDRVKCWITFNEPWVACALGYCSGEHAPGHKSAPSSEPYVAAHHMILAHAKAVQCYNDEFRPTQRGLVGITLNMDWKESLTNSARDIAAQRRALDWQLGWFADPIYKGDYPSSMRKRCGSRLPTFTDAEKDMVKGSSDFFGLNHYSTDYVSSPANFVPPREDQEPAPSRNYFEDHEVDQKSDPAWRKTDMGWDIVPWGLGRLVTWIHEEYAPPGGIIITENGCAVREDSIENARADVARVEYLQGYLAQLHKAITAGVDVRGYFVWSFMDNFEWAFGYSKTFGIVHVDRMTQVRTPKASALMFSELARQNILRLPAQVAESAECVPASTSADQGQSILHPEAESPNKTSDIRSSKPGTRKSSVSSGRLPGWPESLAVDQARELLKDLVAGYESPACQNSLIAVYKKYSKDGDEVAMARGRRDACLPVQSVVLPKYGFEGTYAGVMRSTQFFTHDAAVLADQECSELSGTIQYIINETPFKALGEEFGDTRPPLASFGSVALYREVVSSGDGAGLADAPPLPKSTKPPPFTLERAKRLQYELHAGFSSEDFKEKLRALADLPNLSAARRQTKLQILCLSVQKDILPKYGFEATPVGVMRMISSFAPFNSDPEVARIGAEIDHILKR